MIKNFISKLFGAGSGRNLIEEKQVETVMPKKAMREIYLEKKWGGKKHDFYSGFGSHSKKVVKAYVKGVAGFLNSKEKKLTVYDLGCGDFNVGSQLVSHAHKYHAFDVVEELIARNKQKFQHANLTFDCIDIVQEELPSGDCVLIRQVLQHLSNQHIIEVLPKLKNFKYAIITEHLPKGEFAPNLDKITGANIRLSRGSGVVLHEPPFNLTAVAREELLRVKYNKGVIVTTLYNF